jgi:hypothetical protein
MNYTIQDAISEVKKTGRPMQVESLLSIDEIRSQIKNRKGCGLFKKDKDATIVHIYPSNDIDKNLSESDS